VFSRLALGCALVYLLAIPAVARLGTPQEPSALIGTWVLRVPNSEGLPLPDVKSQTITITCVGNRVEISATTNGEESVARFVADGKQRKGRTIPPMSGAEVTSSRWEGTSLVLTMTIGSWVTGVSTVTERWTPSIDGHTLTRSWGEFKTLAMVYDKQPAQRNDIPRVQESEEYSVYTAVLESEFAQTEVQQFVIRGETQRIEDPEICDRVARDVESDTMSDFKAKNGKTYLLERHLDLKTPYVLVNSDELDAIFNQKAGVLIVGGWGLFYQRYPGAPGLIDFSRVAFDSKKNQALVYLGYSRNYLGGGSSFLVLSKADKSWKIQKQVTLFLY